MDSCALRLSVYCQKQIMCHSFVLSQWCCISQFPFKKNETNDIHNAAKNDFNFLFSLFCNKLANESNVFFIGWHNPKSKSLHCNFNKKRKGKILNENRNVCLLSLLLSGYVIVLDRFFIFSYTFNVTEGY